MKKRSWATHGLLILWVSVVVCLYYVAHKPFEAPNVLAVGRALSGLWGASLVVALGGGVGLLVLATLDFSPAERLVWAAALGLGVVSLVGLGLGAVGLLRPWLLWALTVVGLAATARPLWGALKDVSTDSSWRPRGRLQILLAAYCVAMLTVGLTWALTPPTAWDGLVYHLTGPKLYLTSGRISHPIDLPYLGFPQLAEMLFTWGMGIAGERAAAPIHWFCGLLALFALITAGRRWLGEASGWLGAVMLLSADTVVLLLGWPYVELILLLYSTLAFFALVRWTEEQSEKWLTLSGVFAGLALSTKYTALALLPALGLTLFVLQSRNRRSVIRDLQSALRPVLVLCAIVLLVWTPWLIKNLLLTGNPVYPFFFDGIDWDDWRAWWYDRSGTGLVYTAPLGLITAPWDATIWGVEGGAGYSATIGPLYLALLPLLFLVCRRLEPRHRRWLQGALAFCAVLYAFWLWGVARTALLRQTRLLLPSFGVFALMAGVAVERLWVLPPGGLDLGWIVRAIVVAVLALTLIGTLMDTLREQPLQGLLGFEGRDEFLARRLGWYYPTVQYINEELPQGSAILFLWEPRSYYCRVDCHPDALLDHWLYTIHIHGHDNEAIASAWRAEGFTHVLLCRAGYEAILEASFDPISESDRVTLRKLLVDEAVMVEHFGAAYEIYSLGR